jgi:transposase
MLNSEAKILKIKRKEEVISRLLKGEKLKQVLLDFPELKLTETSWSRLKKKYQAEGLNGLADKRKGAVVYKLKPEVKARILEEKKANTGLSVQQLQVLIFQHFKVEISQSYISQLLKEHGLNNKVGRPLLAGSAAFKPQNLGGSEVSTASVPTPSIGDGLTKMSAEIAQPVEKTPAEELPPEPEKEQITSPETSTPLPANPVEIEETQVPAEQSALVSQAQEAPKQEEKQPEVEPLEDKIIQPIENKEDKLESLAPVEKLPATLKTFAGTLYHLKVNQTDNSFFFIDGQLNTLWKDSLGMENYSLQYDDIGGLVEQYLLQPKPEHPMIIFTLPGFSTSEDIFVNLVFAFENIAPKIIKSVQLGGNLNFNSLYSNELGHIEPKRRYFVTLLRPWQYRGLENFQNLELFQEVNSGLSDAASLEKISQGDLAVIDPRTKTKVLLRAILLFRKFANHQGIACIITNIRREEEPQPIKIVRAYFQRWQNQEDLDYLKSMSKIPT